MYIFSYKSCKYNKEDNFTNVICNLIEKTDTALKDDDKKGASKYEHSERNLF